MKKNSGQSLIEVIIGVGVAVMLAISLITTSLVTQRTARSARNNTQATKLAQGYIEEIRAYRDRKGFGALTEGACITINKGYTPPASPNPSQTDPLNWFLTNINICTPAPAGEKFTLNGIDFYRYIDIVDVAGTPVVKRTVKVTVNWTETSGPKSVNAQTILTKWEGLP